MQLKCVEKSKDSIKIEIKDADTTIIMPIIERLNDMKDVKYARYIDTHPELDTPKLQVVMNDGKDVAAAINNVVDELGKYFETVKQN